MSDGRGNGKVTRILVPGNGWPLASDSGQSDRTYVGGAGKDL